MWLRLSRLQSRAEHDAGTGHFEWLEHPSTEQRLVVRSRSPRQRVSQQSGAKIRVLESRINIVLQLITRKELIEPLDRIVHIGIHRICSNEIRWHTRESGSMRGQVGQ